MIDNEKTKELLEFAINVTDSRSETVTIPMTVAKNALNMLKEQEPLEPISEGFGWYCCKCKEKLFVSTKRKEYFCSQCGQAVKW